MSVDRAVPKRAPVAVAPDAVGDGVSAVCEACGAPLEPDDDFCPECGVELPAGRRLRRRRRLRIAAVAAVLLAAVGAAATFAVLWQSEASSGDRARSQVQAATRDAAVAQATQERLARQLAATRVKLAQVERLADVRAGVVGQANQAVKQVEPLLSSVDSLRRLTGKIQTSRNQFAEAANDVVDSLIDFSNAVLEAQQSGDELDGAWVAEQIDSLNGDLDSLADRYDALDSADAAYGRASKRFEARANDFNLAIRTLRQQLQAVLEP
jgi:predicted nucleic acid-binding Zn ribbon protein/chromosome segregation ATPase